MKTARVTLESWVKRQLLKLTNSPLAGYLVPFLPESAHRTAYMLPNVPPHPANLGAREFALPPKHLHVGGYGDTADQYLQYGQAHMQKMLDQLRQAA